MGDPIVTDRRNLIDLANRECGYRSVFVEEGATARWSNKGNLVVEHNRQGTEDVCRGGRVISRDQPLQRRDTYVPSYPTGPSYPPPSYDDNSGRIRQLIEMSHDAKRYTTSYSSQNQQVSEILHRAISMATNAEQICWIANAAKTDTASYSTQNAVVSDAMARGAVVLRSAWDAVKLADCAKETTGSYSTQNEAVSRVISAGAQVARTHGEFDALRRAAERDTSSYSTQNSLLATIQRAELNAVGY